MKEIFVIMISAVFVDNFVLSKFMGICPFLGVSKKLSSSLGMGFRRCGLDLTQKRNAIR